MSVERQRRAKERAATPRPFDAAQLDWVSVTAAWFFFEPWCSELRPAGEGSLVVVFGDTTTRSRGVEVRVLADGGATVWVPVGGRVFWLPERRAGDPPDEPWETRLEEFDHQSGDVADPLMPARPRDRRR